MDRLFCEIGGVFPELEPQITSDDTDLPPEFCRYKDEGCENAASCLDCPFPRCLYEEPRGRQRWMKNIRNREINRLFAGGKKIKDLALIFGLSPRTVLRAIRGK